MPRISKTKNDKIKPNEFVIGIDEAGRGPLCGPVAVGAFMVEKKAWKKLRKTADLEKLTDSKKLSEKIREKIFKEILKLRRDKKANFSVALVNEKIIDENGIAFAIRFGVKRVLKSLEKSVPKKIKFDRTQILLDGSLKAPENFQFQKTIIKGDLSESEISAASIVAKVSRDRHMKKLAQIFPQYKIEQHKGYGTVEHRRLIKKYGVSKIHRRSFCRNVK